MKTKTAPKKYPMLSVRMTDAELSYIRRRAKEASIKVSRYVKETLAPAWAIVDKK